MEKLIALISGVLFGAGVTISGMVNPMKVLNFFDIFGTWDATLIFVMGAGLLVTLLGYQIIFRRKAPLFAPSFRLPTSQDIDAKLLGGAALFGVGWGLRRILSGPCRCQSGFWPRGKHYFCDRHGGRHGPHQANSKTICRPPRHDMLQPIPVILAAHDPEWPRTAATHARTLAGSLAQTL